MDRNWAHFLSEGVYHVVAVVQPLLFTRPIVTVTKPVAMNLRLFVQNNCIIVSFSQMTVIFQPYIELQRLRFQYVSLSCEVVFKESTFYNQHNADVASLSGFHNQICFHSKLLKGYPGFVHCFPITSIPWLFNFFTHLNSCWSQRSCWP